MWFSRWGEFSPTGKHVVSCILGAGEFQFDCGGGKSKRATCKARGPPVAHLFSGCKGPLPKELLHAKKQGGHMATSLGSGPHPASGNASQAARQTHGGSWRSDAAHGVILLLLLLLLIIFLILIFILISLSIVSAGVTITLGHSSPPERKRKRRIKIMKKIKRKIMIISSCRVSKSTLPALLRRYNNRRRALR
jgi:hypothetical protein